MLNQFQRKLIMLASAWLSPETQLQLETASVSWV